MLGFDSVQNRHRDISHNHIGAKTQGFGHERCTVPCRSNDLDVRAQHGACSLEQGGMVIRQ
jgi:hypothetical protein